MSHPLRALMPQVSNLSVLGAPILTQILALLYSRSSLSDVLPPGRISRCPTCRAAPDAVCGGRGIAAHLPGVDLDPRHCAEHHRAELSRPAGFRLHLRRNIVPHVQLLCDMVPGNSRRSRRRSRPPVADIKGAAE